jgi:hypothetical protein
MDDGRWFMVDGADGQWFKASPRGGSVRGFWELTDEHLLLEVHMPSRLGSR